MSLSQELVLKASKALLTYVENRKNGEDSSDLLGDEKQVVQLIIGVKKLSAKGRHKPYRIPLRVPLYDESSEVCVFTKASDKEHLERIKNLGVPQIKEAISILQLKHDYKPYEARRQLLDSYDLFLADDRIIKSLPEALGTKFFTKKKLPSPVDLTAKNVKSEISKALSCTYFSPTKGTCSAVKVGTTDMTAEQLAQNIESAAEAIAERIPKKWDNIQSLSIKTGKSLALPIYNSLPDPAEAIGPVTDLPSEETEARSTKKNAKRGAAEEDAPQPKKSKKSPLSRPKAAGGAAARNSAKKTKKTKA